MNKAKAVEKVKKLIALSESSNPNESKLALERAEKLANAYHLTPDDFGKVPKRKARRSQGQDNVLVKFISDDDGEICEIYDEETGEWKKNDVWCLVDPTNHQGPARFCTQEFFGEGESEAVFEIKTVKRGGITCPECLAKLRIFKAVRL